MVETPLKTLIERFRSKPEWQHTDPAVRAEAVLRMPSSERDVVLALAREDADARVRRAAVKKLADVEVLAEVAARDSDAGVRDEAETRLGHLAVHERDEAAARAAVAALREPRHLAAVAKTAPLAATRDAAVRALADARLLASVVRESEDVATRLLALGRIDDTPTLLSLALKLEQKTVAVAAVERLSDADALKAVAAKAKAGAAQRRARARLETGEPATPVVTVPVPAGDDEAERRAYEEARAAHAREAEARRRALEARTALVASVEAAEGDAIPSAIERARAERPALPTLPAAEAASFDERFDAALEAAGKRHQAFLAGVARREELAELVNEAESLAGQELGAARAALSALEARWRQATADAQLPDLRARFEAAAQALRERGQAAREEQAQKEKEHLQLLLSLADRAEALVGKGASAPLREADQSLREIREALEHPGHFATRKERDSAVARLEAARRHLYPLVQQLREDAEWKRWANVSVQQELCAEAEALVAEEDLERAAGVLRDLDARWKQAKEAPKEKAEALWKRFKAARDQVKTKTDAYFAKQAEELAGNFKRKEALCERAEALSESTDWLRTAEELRKLQAEWKAIGPVARAASQRVWERFRLPCDRFFTRWQEHRDKRSHEWAENLAKKEGLCAQAEALRESSDWEAASVELKRLQAEWRTIGAVKKSRSEAVWQRFRAACDHFFDRYKNRDEHARHAVRQAREGICADLEALVPADGDPAEEPPADLVPRLHAAQTAWRQAGSLPHDEMGALDERFARARDRLVQVFPRAFEGSDLDPEASRRKAEKLVQRVESLLDELAPGGAARPQTGEELAARLRDALAANTIGGRAAVEAKWHSAAAEVEAAQAGWKRLGPVPGTHGQELARRFEQACKRFLEVRPRPEKAERPRADRPGTGRAFRPRADRPARR